MYRIICSFALLLVCVAFDFHTAPASAATEIKGNVPTIEELQKLTAKPRSKEDVANEIGSPVFKLASTTGEDLWYYIREIKSVKGAIPPVVKRISFVVLTFDNKTDLLQDYLTQEVHGKQTRSHKPEGETTSFKLQSSPLKYTDWATLVSNHGLQIEKYTELAKNMLVGRGIELPEELIVNE